LVLGGRCNYLRRAHLHTGARLFFDASSFHFLRDRRMLAARNRAGLAVQAIYATQRRPLE
jgi:hypothetical protein